MSTPSNIGLGAATADAAQATEEVMMNADKYLEQFMSGDFSGIPEAVLACLRKVKAEADASKTQGSEQIATLTHNRSRVLQNKKSSLHEIKATLAAAGLLPESATNLLARKFAPVEWIIEDLLAARGGASRGFKGDIIAGSKMRKTFFALQLAASVAAGRDFLGFHVPKARRVLYLNLELREDFTQERMRKIEGALGAPLGNLKIMTPSKPYLLRNRYTTDRDGGRKLIEGYEDEFLKYASGEGFELILVDPQYKLEFPEEDENSGQGMGGILRWRDRIITETGAACVIVHHDPKSGGTDRDLTQRGAGSSFSGRDYDTRMALDAHADGDPLHEVLECGSRVRPSPDPVTAVFDTGTFTFSVDAEIPAKRKTAKPEKLPPAERERRNREEALKAAREIFAEHTKEVEARAAQTRRDPEPVEYLLGCTDFKSRLAQRANLGREPLKEQYKLLIENKEIAWQGKLKLDDGKAKLDGATILHGRPVDIEAYRTSYGLTPTGEELRGGIKSRVLA